MISLILSTLLTISIQSSNTHTMQGIVDSTENNSIYIVTEDGNGWYLEDNTSFTEGQQVTITFDTLGTESIYDDVIINIR